MFKLWLSRVEANRNKVDYLHSDQRGEFISAIV